MKLDSFKLLVSEALMSFPGVNVTEGNLAAWHKITSDLSDADIMDALDDIAKTETGMTRNSPNIAAMILSRKRRGIDFDSLSSVLKMARSYPEIGRIDKLLMDRCYFRNLLGLDSEQRKWVAKELAEWFEDKVKRTGHKITPVPDEELSAWGQPEKGEAKQEVSMTLQERAKAIEVMETNIANLRLQRCNTGTLELILKNMRRAYDEQRRMEEGR